MAHRQNGLLLEERAIDSAEAPVGKGDAIARHAPSRSTSLNRRSDGCTRADWLRAVSSMPASVFGRTGNAHNSRRASQWPGTPRPCRGTEAEVRARRPQRVTDRREAAISGGDRSRRSRPGGYPLACRLLRRGHARSGDRARPAGASGQARAYARARPRGRSLPDRLTVPASALLAGLAGARSHLGSPTRHR